MQLNRNIMMRERTKSRRSTMTEHGEKRRCKVYVRTVQSSNANTGLFDLFLSGIAKRMPCPGFRAMEALNCTLQSLCNRMHQVWVCEVKVLRGKMSLNHLKPNGCNWSQRTSESVSFSPNPASQLSTKSLFCRSAIRGRCCSKAGCRHCDLPKKSYRSNGDFFS